MHKLFCELRDLIDFGSNYDRLEELEKFVDWLEEIISESGHEFYY